MHQRVWKQFRHASEEISWFLDPHAPFLKSCLLCFPFEEVAPEPRAQRTYFHSVPHHNWLVPTEKQQTPFKKYCSSLAKKKPNKGINFFFFKQKHLTYLTPSVFLFLWLGLGEKGKKNFPKTLWSWCMSFFPYVYRVPDLSLHCCYNLLLRWIWEHLAKSLTHTKSCVLNSTSPQRFPKPDTSVNNNIRIFVGWILETRFKISI